MNAQEIFNNLCKLNLLEISELLKLLKKKFNFHTSENNLSSTIYNDNKLIKKNSLNNNNNKNISQKYKISLISVGTNKILAIKLIKELFGLNLKEAHSLLSNLPYNMPGLYKNNKMLEIIKKFEAINCVVKSI